MMKEMKKIKKTRRIRTTAEENLFAPKSKGK